MFAGACGLDGGVEREEVGLIGDVVDDQDDLADLVALLAEFADHGGGACDLSGDLFDLVDGLLDDGLALDALPRDFVGGGGHLFRGRRDPRGLLGLLGESCGHLLAAGGDLGRGAGDLGRHAADLSDEFVEVVEEGVEPAGELPDLVRAVEVDAFGQVALAGGDVADHGDELVDGFGEESAEQEGEAEACADDDGHADPQTVGDEARDVRVEGVEGHDDLVGAVGVADLPALHGETEGVLAVLVGVELVPGAPWSSQD